MVCFQRGGTRERETDRERHDYHVFTLAAMHTSFMKYIYICPIGGTQQRLINCETLRGSLKTRSMTCTRESTKLIQLIRSLDGIRGVCIENRDVPVVYTANLHCAFDPRESTELSDLTENYKRRVLYAYRQIVSADQTWDIIKPETFHLFNVRVCLTMGKIYGEDIIIMSSLNKYTSFFGK